MSLAAGLKFLKVFYLEFGKTGDGHIASSPAAIPTTAIALWAIPAGTLIERCYAIIDTLLTGTTALNVGDDDSSNGFIPTAALTLGTVGLYGWDAKSAGSYLRIQTAGATDPGDIYVVPASKLYSAAGKSLKVAGTTANTAGKLRIIVEGVFYGTPSY